MYSVLRYCVFLLLSISSLSALSQNYPNRPITMIVPFAPGGSADAISRPLADHLGRILKQPIIISNRGGGGGAPGTAYALAAKADGYTILFNLSTISATPEADKLFDKKPQYELKQLAPIALISSEPLVLVAKTDSPFNSLSDVTRAAKSKPGQITYGSSGVYGPIHLAMEMYTNEADIKLQHVPFTGAGPALASLLGGHVDLLILALNTALTHQKSGSIKILASWASQRNRLIPNVPTLKESGLNIEYPNWSGLFVSSNTPDDIILTLRNGVRSLSKNPDYLKSMDALNLSVTYMDAPEFESFWRTDAIRTNEVLKKIGRIE
jgi:tripartite-type tricarboxylate transporter receptor subunit TctC